MIWRMVPATDTEFDELKDKGEDGLIEAEVRINFLRMK
jgi:hypothetical protein